MMDEKLRREGKIALLKKEIEELTVRIRNRQNAIRWAVSLTHTFDELAERVPDLKEAVSDYQNAFQQLKEAQNHLKRLKEN